MRSTSHDARDAVTTPISAMPHTMSATATKRPGVVTGVPVAVPDGRDRRDRRPPCIGVLFALSKADERTLRMSTLAGYSNSSLSRLSRAVARLEAKHWVRRCPDPGDGRYTLATLTRQGKQKVEQAAPGHIDLVNQLIFENLTPAQALQLRELSRTIMRRSAPTTGGNRGRVPNLRVMTDPPRAHPDPARRQDGRTPGAGPNWRSFQAWSAPAPGARARCGGHGVGRLRGNFCTCCS